MTRPLPNDLLFLADALSDEELLTLYGEVLMDYRAAVANRQRMRAHFLRRNADVILRVIEARNLLQ